MTFNYNNIPTPWLGSYGEVPPHLEYPEVSLSAAVLSNATTDPDYPALSFMGREITYRTLAEEVDCTARAFYAQGVRPGMRVLVCLPNVPQAIYSIYGLNRIRAVATMAHPLSAIGEIIHYMDEASCDYAVTLDQCYAKFLDVKKQRSIRKLIVTRISEELPFPLSLGQKLMTERKFPKVIEDGNVLLWKHFIASGASVTDSYAEEKDPMGEAVVLFSGGTTGVTKGIMLSDLNFNALALQTEAMCHEEVRHCRMLAAMPVFHGFGLGVCIHTVLVGGGTAILVPRFHAKSFARLIRKTRPDFISGVPTLFEAITRNTCLDGVDLSCLRGVFSGGDSLSTELKKKLDRFLADHNACVRVREGYGTTECVTASCLTPYNKEKEGSIGLPYPDTYYKICKPGSCEALPYGEEGEICMTGPTVMLGYINHEEENAAALRRHADGHVWLHTGDLGLMDEEGFLYFRQRIKRMIVTSGYNVYPSQIENILEGHPAVHRSCVIGVPDPLKMQKVKALVVLRDGVADTPEVRASILEHCRANIAKYAMPAELEICDSLPTTLVGKVAYTKLS